MLGPVVYTVRSWPLAGHEQQFNRWQVEEHCPRLLALPGYHSVLRFRMIDDIRGYMNVWDIESREPFDSPAHSVASNTPWKAEVAPLRERHCVDFYEDGVAGTRAGSAAADPVRGLMRYDIGKDSPSDLASGIVRRSLENPDVCAVRALKSTSTPGARLVMVYLRTADPTKSAAIEGVEETRYFRINGFEPQ